MRTQKGKKKKNKPNFSTTHEKSSYIYSHAPRHLTHFLSSSNVADPRQKRAYPAIVETNKHSSISSPWCREPTSILNTLLLRKIVLWLVLVD